MSFILFTKVLSSVATSEPEILSVSVFYNNVKIFQLTLQETEPNSGDRLIKQATNMMYGSV
jgi:hypothetical protein